MKIWEDAEEEEDGREEDEDISEKWWRIMLAIIERKAKEAWCDMQISNVESMWIK